MSLNVLAIDAGTEALSVAINSQNKTFSHFEVCPQQHSQKILPLISEGLEQAETKLNVLDFIAFGRGPGSFTGVRISVAIAQGLAYSANIPVVGVSSLQTMAQQAAEQYDAKIIYAAIDARMAEIYFAKFKVDSEGLAQLIDQEIVIKPELVDLEDEQAIAVGTGFVTYPELIKNKTNITLAHDITLPNAQYMLALATDAYNRNEQVDAASAEPVYVRDTVTWKKLPGKG